MKQQPADDTASPARQFPRALAVTGSLVLASIAVSALFAWAVTLFMRVNPSQPVQPARGAVSGPVLQTAPSRDLEALLEEKRARLNGYGWVNPRAHEVHIPIEVAMQIMADRAAAGGSLSAAERKP